MSMILINMIIVKIISWSWKACLSLAAMDNWIFFFGCPFSFCICFMWIGFLNSWYVLLLESLVFLGIWWSHRRWICYYFKIILRAYVWSPIKVKTVRVLWWIEKECSEKEWFGHFKGTWPPWHRREEER